MPGEKKILIIDDEVDIVEILGVRLVASGYSVEKAYDGEEGLKKMRQWRPDLILLDLVMPRMGGVEVIQEMKGDPELAGIFVIVLTAKSQEVGDGLAEEIGAENYMLKPFDMEELMGRIRKRLGELS